MAIIKILIVDDQKILLDAFTNAISRYADMKIVGSITEAEAADIACLTYRPDLVLMDICVDGDISGIYATKRIKTKYPYIKVVLMTGFPEISFIRRGEAAGADSFIYKSSSMKEFIACIRSTMAGEKHFPTTSRKITFGDDQCTLTQRELEILRLYSLNYSRKEMAEAMSISESTINFHVNNMLTKTGYKSLLKLALEAANKGYINTKA